MFFWFASFCVLFGSRVSLQSYGNFIAARSKNCRAQSTPSSASLIAFLLFNFFLFFYRATISPSGTSIFSRHKGVPFFFCFFAYLFIFVRRIRYCFIGIGVPLCAEVSPFSLSDLCSVCSCSFSLCVFFFRFFFALHFFVPRLLNRP